MGQRSGGNPQAFARGSPPSRSPAPRWEVLPAGVAKERTAVPESRPPDQDDKAWGAYHRRAPRITAGACSGKDLHSHSAYRYCRSRCQTTKEVSIGSLPRPSASPPSGGALPSSAARETKPRRPKRPCRSKRVDSRKRLPPASINVVAAAGIQFDDSKLATSCSAASKSLHLISSSRPTRPLNFTMTWRMAPSPSHTTVVNFGCSPPADEPAHSPPRTESARAG